MAAAVLLAIYCLSYVFRLLLDYFSGTSMHCSLIYRKMYNTLHPNSLYSDILYPTANTYPFTNYSALAALGTYMVAQ